MSLTSKLQDIPYVIGYDEKDCKKPLSELIEDIGESVKKRLTAEITEQPLKFNIIIIYHAIM